MIRREPEQIFSHFVNDVIEEYGDTKSADWLTLSQDLEELVNKERGYEINILSPRSCLIESLNSNRNHNLSTHIDKLENAFYCLSLYAINLCRKPIKKYCQHIKTYSGFYTCNIGSVMNGEDLAILLSMGYRVIEKGNEEELILSHVSQHIKQLAFQLYLSQLYCRRIKMIISAINGYGYSDEVAIRLLEHVHKPEFNVNEIVDYCKLEQLNLEKGQDKQKPYDARIKHTYEQMEWQSSSMLHSFQHEDVVDDDLYGVDQFGHTSTPGSDKADMNVNIGRGPPANDVRMSPMLKDGVKLPPSYEGFLKSGSRFYPQSYVDE